MSVQRIRGVEVIEGVPKVSRQQRRFMQARIRKIAAVGAVTDRISAMHRAAHEQILEETRQGVVQINGHDAWVERMGSEAAQTHEVVKGNFYQTQMGLLQRLNQEAQTMQDDLLDEIAALPDAFWYDRSLKARLAAFVLDDTYLELEDRGLPRLTFGEHVREILAGDVVDRKVSTFDQWQANERQTRRAQVRAIAAAQGAIGLPAGAEAGELPASVLTEDEREALLQEALRRRNARRQEWEEELQEVSDADAIE